MSPLDPRRPAPADVAELTLALLRQHVSPITAQSIVRVARERVGASGPIAESTQVRAFMSCVGDGLRLFVADPQQLEQCRRNLEAMAGAPASSLPERVVFAVRREEDIARIRREAREHAAARGFTVVGQTRFTTAVSELVRNIVQYAGSGELELGAAPPSELEVVARDRGPGIANLDQILAGRYRSKLGMGLGLRGVKNLADRFEVQTAPGRGTTVTFTMRAS